jgi:hypothetical protein
MMTALSPVSSHWTHSCTINVRSGDLLTVNLMIGPGARVMAVMKQLAAVVTRERPPSGSTPDTKPQQRSYDQKWRNKAEIRRSGGIGGTGRNF